jgi:NAD+ synthetase
MCGGLAVISDVPKTQVYRLARYVNRDQEIIPRATIEKAPSAELRPNQTDQDSLPPYEVLDAILLDYIEDYKSAEQIARDHGFDLALVKSVLRMVDRNEYKRQQAAVGLKISEKAFGVGRRMPIAAKSEE